MKAFTLLSLLCFATLLSFAQDTPRGLMVPDDVLTKFERDFPDAGPEQWRMLSRDMFVAKFRLNGFLQRAHYNGIGSWQYTDIEVSEKQMPEAALDHYRSTFGKYPVVSMGLRDAQFSYFYIEILRSGVKRKLKYDEEGNFIQ